MDLETLDLPSLLIVLMYVHHVYITRYEEMSVAFIRSLAYESETTHFFAVAFKSNRLAETIPDSFVNFP